MAYAYYTRPTGGDMLSIEQRWSRSDTIDVAYRRLSRDHGRTWSTPVESRTGERRPGGMLRRHPRGVWVDPVSRHALEFWIEGTLPSDDPLEGLKQWNIYYTIDGGKEVHQLIHHGPAFGPAHPLPGVYTGKNSVMLGDNTCLPITRRDGAILLPVCVTPLQADGSLYNPTGGYTYHDAAVVIGRWKGARIEWEMGDPISGDPQRSTRGMVEPTIAELPDGRLMLVMRGSNDRNPAWPAHKWVSYSTDARRWTKPEPWSYTDGTPFYSPSACSQLLSHSSGRLFWLGNITPSNPRGNRPRYPFQRAEVDLETGTLRRGRVRVVDDKGPAENELLTLSNFFAREDRRTRQVLIHMTRLFALPGGWEGDAMLYRVEP